MFAESLFTPFTLKTLTVKNRFVMAPMAQEFSVYGVPGLDLAAYYCRRAIGQVGLILSERTAIGRPAAANTPRVPHFYGERALTAWQHLAAQVHEAGSQMGPQLWHAGIVNYYPTGWLAPIRPEGPSGLLKPGKLVGQAMTIADIEATIGAFGEAAAAAQRLGFDCLEIEGAHGYLLDQFFWGALNQRTDAYGGRTLAARSRLAVELVREVRRRVGPDFVISLRLAQWKPQDFLVKLAATPQELEAWLVPLAEAGVDVFHCLQRQFWESEFTGEGSDLNFAGWAKKLTGKATITAGAIGVPGAVAAPFAREEATRRALEELERRFDRQEFDLVAVGRALLADPHWVEKVRQDRLHEVVVFEPEAYYASY